MGKSYERDGLFGKYTEHYDDDGNKIGESRERDGIFGTYIERTDAAGNKIGESRDREGFFGAYTEHTDTSGRKTGESREREGLFGRYTEHTDASSRKTGESREREGLFGRYTEHAGTGYRGTHSKGREARDRERSSYSTASNSGSSSTYDANFSYSSSSSSRFFWIIAIVVVIGAVVGFTSTFRSKKVPVMLPDTPSYMHSEHRLVLAKWLLRNPKFRPAVTADCHCDEDLPAIRRNYDNELPYYVSGDFNRDGHTDFAVVLIDQSKDTSQALKVTKRNPDGSANYTFDTRLGFNTALVIFNGPTTGVDRPALFVEGIGSPIGSVLFYNKAESRFLIGKWESSGFLIIAPSRDGYILQQ